MIKISNLIFKYKTNAFTIKVDNFYVDRGKIILIKGYNGSGKTTFLKILAGILKPQNGEIYIGDKKIQNYIFLAHVCTKLYPERLHRHILLTNLCLNRKSSPLARSSSMKMVNMDGQFSQRNIIESF